jgi:hypothetical protein
VEVGDVEPADGAGGAGLALVARVAAHALVAARAEGERAGAGQDDHPDRGVLARALEGLRELDDGLGTEGVADLGTVDRDLRDAAGELVADVLEVTAPVAPVGACLDRPLLLLGDPGVAVEGLFAGGHTAANDSPATASARTRSVRRRRAGSTPGR